MKVFITEFDLEFNIDFTPENFAEVATLARLSMNGTKLIISNSTNFPWKSGVITHSIQIGKARRWTSTLQRS